MLYSVFCFLFVWAFYCGNLEIISLLHANSICICFPDEEKIRALFLKVHVSTIFSWDVYFQFFIETMCMMSMRLKYNESFLQYVTFWQDGCFSNFIFLALFMTMYHIKCVMFLFCKNIFVVETSKLFSFVALTKLVQIESFLLQRQPLF